MTKQNYIGKDLANFLHKARGCGKDKPVLRITYYDIIVTHATEFFGEAMIENASLIRTCNTEYLQERASKLFTDRIKDLLQQGKQTEADKYIKEHCVFNPKN